MITDRNKANTASDDWWTQFTHLGYVRVDVTPQHLRIQTNVRYYQKEKAKCYSYDSICLIVFVSDIMPTT